MFQPSLTGSGNLADFTWPSICRRFFVLVPVSFFALVLLVGLLKLARPLFRWLFTWRTLKWSLRTVAAFFALMAFLYFEENWRGKRAWDNYRRGAEARGEKFDFASYIPASVPDEQNFALTPIVASSYSRVMDKSGQRIEPENTNVVNRLKMDIYRTKLSIKTNQALGEWQKGRLTSLKAWQDYYRTMFLTNRWEDSWKGIPPPWATNLTLGGMSGAPVTNDNIVVLDTNEFSTATHPQSPAADVLLALSKYNSDIEELRQASKLPYSRFPVNYTASDPTQIIFPHWAALRSCALVLRLRAIAELDNGQPDKALTDVRLMLYLANSIRHEPNDYSIDQQMSLVNFAVQAVWEGLARRQWSDAQLMALEHDLAGIDAVKDYSFAMRAGLASNLKSLEYLRTERWKNSITCMCGDTMWGPTLIYRFSPGGWFYLNERATAIAFEAALPTAEEATQRILSPKIMERFGHTFAQEQRRCIIPDNLWLSFVPPLGRKAMNVARLQAGVDMVRIACALERYQQTYGDYPDNLDALMPQFIEKIPHDIVNGQPLHYRRMMEGRFILYSVGWDGKDDDGTPEDTKRLFRPRSKGDWVWQYPAQESYKKPK